MQEHCWSTIERLLLDAAVPRFGELSYGPDGLATRAAAHEVPYVAANLYAAGADKPFFPRFLFREFDGLQIAIIGVVGYDMHRLLSSSDQALWRIEDPAVSIQAAVEQIRRQLGRRPDVTILLVASDTASFSRIDAGNLVDVVIGDSDGIDPREIWRIAHVAPGSPDSALYSGPLHIARASEESVTHLAIHFEPREGAPPLLESVQQWTLPVLETGPRDVSTS